MARTINEQEYAGKRKDILDAATRLVYSKGYERMAIGDILADLGISSGAFYHYFDSKPALLEALIERMIEQAEGSLREMVRDATLTALEKFQRFFGWIEQARISQQANIADLTRIWYNDDNAIVREKVEAGIIQRRARLMTEIIRQGLAEGTFSPAYPDQAGEIVLVLWSGMGRTHARLMLSLGNADLSQAEIAGIVDEVVAVHSAYMDAIERAAGAPAGFLRRIDAAAVQFWVDPARGNGQK